MIPRWNAKHIPEMKKGAHHIWRTPDWSSSLNLIFMLVAVCGYLCIPSIASWVVQANGFAAYNKTVSKMTSLVSAGAGWTAGKAWAGAKGAGSAALSGGKAVGRGIMNGARLIFRK